MKDIERFVVAAAVLLLTGTLALGNVRSTASPAPAARLRPEQIATMPARIQTQLAGTTSVSATGSHAATASMRWLRPEQVVTLPARIQAQVAGTAIHRTPALAPEDIATLPSQIQDQVRRSIGLTAAPTDASFAGSTKHAGAAR